ncbi:flavin reductase family protein [Streptomyces lasalocidi]
MITARGAAGPVGFTATSLTSVSADPPLISFGIGTGASSWPAIAETDHVGVHILGEHQGELVEHLRPQRRRPVRRAHGLARGPARRTGARRRARLAGLPDRRPRAGG